MKPKLTLIAIGTVLAASCLTTFAQGTMFTYQGRVTDNGTNFTGTGLFKFALVTSTNTSSQATATAIMGGSSPNEFVNNYNVLNGGSGYLAAPAVTVSPPGGSGTTATATATITSGSVTAINIISPGSGYSSTPTVTIDAPPPNVLYNTYWSNDGTSSDGSEPAAAVSVPVADGLFTAALGDTTLANMSAMDASLFTQPDLQLRIWFNDGVNGSAVLDPAQPLTPAPYAVMAETASNLLGSVSATQLSGTILNSSLPANPNISGAVTANSFSGNGANLNSLNASNLSSGVVPLARLSGLTGSEFDPAAWQQATNLSGGDAASLNGSSANHFWQLGGNNVAAGQFIGSTNNEPVEIRVGGQSALRLEPAQKSSPNVIGGSGFNTTSNGSWGVTIAGGGQYGFPNNVTVNAGAIGGGYGNTVSGYAATVGGGQFNTAGAGEAVVGGGNENRATGDTSTVSGGGYNNASGYLSTVGGGLYNVASGERSTLAGGNQNNASGYGATVGGGIANTNTGNIATIGGGDHNYVSASEGTVAGGQVNTASGTYQSTVGGGYDNQATNSYATVPGGSANVAGGIYSLAAGRRAKAVHTGAFVWADSQNADFSSTANDQFLVRAKGGVGINTANPVGALSVNTGVGTVAVRNDGGLTPGIDIANGYQGTLRLRNAMEVWPSDDASRAGKLDVRDTNGTPTISLNGQSGAIAANSYSGPNGTLTVNGNLGVTGNISGHNTPGVNWNQSNATITIGSSPTFITSFGNYEPAPGYFVIIAYVQVLYNGNAVYLSLNDVSSGSTQLTYVYGKGPDNGTLSIFWVVPITSSGGYGNFQLTANTASGTAYIYSHNLTVMYFPRRNN